MSKAEVYSKTIDRECLAGGQSPCMTLCFLPVRLLEICPCYAHISLSAPGKDDCQSRWGMPPPCPRREAGSPCFGECICRLFSILCLLSILWGPFYTSLPRFSQMAALPSGDGCSATQMLFIYLFCHFKSNNTEKGIEWDKCLLHPRKKKGTCQFPTCVFLRLRRLSQSVAPLLKASSHSFAARRLLFSEKLGFRNFISKEMSELYGSAGAIYMLHLGNFPLLMVRLTTALWQPVAEIHEGLWRSSVRYDSAPGGSSMGLKYMYCVDVPKALHVTLNLCMKLKSVAISFLGTSFKGIVINPILTVLSEPRISY